MSKRIVFFGNERLATGVDTTVPVLRALLDDGYDVAAVVSQYEIGKSRKPRELEISVVAGEHNIPVLLPQKMADIAGQLAEYKAEAAVLVAFGKIVPQSIIDLFPRGIVNIHPSLLPKHRGSTPLESVILQNDAETGVSLMQLAAKMDAGPLYAQQHVTLQGDETKQQLADKLLDLGKNMLLECLPNIMDGTLIPTDQPADGVTYDEMISKDAGVIDWHKPAAQIEREIRAYAVWPKSRTDIGGRDVVITAAHVIPGSSTPGVIWLEGRQIGMQTSDGILIIDQLVPAGKKTMSGSDFLLGYKPSA